METAPATTPELIVRPYRKLKELSPEQREEHRRAQLRASQLRYREKNGLVKKPRKERPKPEVVPVPEVKTTIPTTYTVDHQRQYHREYYEKNKAKLLARSKEFALKKKKVD